MYSTEQRKTAIELLIKYDLQYAKVVTELGYPSRRELRRWYLHYLETNSYSRKYVGRNGYSDEEKKKAITYFLEHGRNISLTCKKLGYPSRMLLTKWIYSVHPELKHPCSKATPWYT